MRETTFYIDGQWVQPASLATRQIVNPATEVVVTSIAMGHQADVDRAATAAAHAFKTFGATPTIQRLELLSEIKDNFYQRRHDIADAISLEMGAPKSLARGSQTQPCLEMIENFIEVLRDFSFDNSDGFARIVKEPIGVVGVITPWNWPMQQIVRKVIAAIAVGCTIIMKPSEISPLSALVFAEVMDQAGTPAGAFNLINGDGPTVGHAIATHPLIDMITFTGSTRAGILVAKAAADSVKRVHQELGGKSANILFDDIDLEEVVPRDVMALMRNTGQSCNAPSRMLVPGTEHNNIARLAANAVRAIRTGDPRSDAVHLGPLASQAQYDKVQRLIATGISEGAQLVAGGLGRPDGLDRGYYVRPTVFANVSPEMTIAREEIFGPVLSILPYVDEDDAIRIANDTVYGLADYVSTSDINRAKRVGARLKAGNVHFNGSRAGAGTPFGGFKQSGNGRENGVHGLQEFLEIKALIGIDAI